METRGSPRRSPTFARFTPRRLVTSMAERFDGRVQREVLGVTAAGHRDLERLPPGLNPAYNARRQRVLDGRSLEEVVRERLARGQGLADPGYRPPFDPCALPKAMPVIERAKDVSQPNDWDRRVRAPSSTSPATRPTSTRRSAGPSPARTSVARGQRREPRGRGDRAGPGRPEQQNPRHGRRAGRAARPALSPGRAHDLEGAAALIADRARDTDTGRGKSRPAATAGRRDGCGEPGAWAVVAVAIARERTPAEPRAASGTGGWVAACRRWPAPWAGCAGTGRRRPPAWIGRACATGCTATTPGARRPAGPAPAVRARRGPAGRA